MISSESQRYARRDRNYTGIVGSFSGHAAPAGTQTPFFMAQPKQQPVPAAPALKPTTLTFRQLDLF